MPIPLSPYEERAPFWRDWPIATYGLIAANGLVFLTMALVDAFRRPPLTDFLLRTFTGMHADTDLLLAFGASFGPYFHQGEYFRLVMPMFLHIGLIHLLINMYALYILGLLLERVYGYGRFLFLYVLCGIGSSYLSMATSNNVAAGASGAIFGIAGVMLVTGYLHRRAVPPHWARIFGRGMIPFILLNLVLGFAITSYIPIDNWGHIGGLTTGIVLALVVPPPAKTFQWGLGQVRQSPAWVVLPIALVVVSMAAAFEGNQTKNEVTKLVAAGERLRAEHQDDRARKVFEEAAKLAPHDERPPEELGLLDLQENHLAEAVNEYQEALRADPDSPRAQLGLALAYRQKGDLADAQKLLEKALANNPTDAAGQIELADVCGEQKLYSEAVRHYQEALRLEPNNALAQNNLAWLYATSDDPRFRKPPAALDHAERAVALTRWKEPAFIDTLAEALYANGNYREAVQVQTQALELDPQNRDFEAHMKRYQKAAGGT